ncbi:MAG: hypothetical protein A3K77_00750 [Euryarchaeota archaeon RBG_13_31_8]|nr:MAG: hypothetical protein A3K77_00750 [Euryarchaeota archaeon RBG_13_31_8]
MKIELRDYQKIACEKIVNDLDIMPKVLLQAATGAGKTVIVSAIIEKFYLTTDRKILILAHKQELVEQFFNTLHKMSAVNISDIGICSASLKQKKITKRITIGTIQTFINYADNFTCNLLVVDECHRADVNNDTQYKKIIDKLKQNYEQLRILGITATPARRGHGYIYGDKCKKDNINLFSELNHQITYNELVKNNYLMELSGKIATDNEFDNDIKNVSIGSDGDYKQNELGLMMSKSRHLESIKKAINEYCQSSKKICIFCCTIEHAKNVLKLFDNATIIHSELTPLEREANMRSWREGNVKIMASVNILIEGFDFPELDTLIMARPTLSSNLYIQAIGRVVRIVEGKTQALLIDLTNNTNYFGTDIDNIKVSIPKQVEKDIEKEDATSTEKTCPDCKNKIHKALKECIYCGYEFKDIIKYINNMPILQDIKFNQGNNCIEIYPVTEMFITRHIKEGKPDSVKVEYFRSLLSSHDSIKEFLCFEHGGFATQKAQEWWRKMSFGLGPPKNVQEALDNKQNIIKPSQIKIKKDGKSGYWRVIDYIFDKTDFYGSVN